MATIDDDNMDWTEAGDDEDLARRLHTMDWPLTRPELRDRCWQAISDRLEEPASGSRGRYLREKLDLGRSYDFTRRLGEQRIAVPGTFRRSGSYDRGAALLGAL